MAATFFKWDDSLSVQIPEIDNQHQKLIEIINSLYDAFMNQALSERVNEIIKDLTDYAGYHFTTEEKYFDRFNYEKTQEHKKEHKDFVNKLEDFKAKADRNPKALTYEMMTFLRNWLQDHIKGTDRQYVECFKSNGL